MPDDAFATRGVSASGSVTLLACEALTMTERSVQASFGGEDGRAVFVGTVAILGCLFEVVPLLPMHGFFTDVSETADSLCGEISCRVRFLATALLGGERGSLQFPETAGLPDRESGGAVVTMEFASRGARTRRFVGEAIERVRKK